MADSIFNLIGSPGFFREERRRAPGGFLLIVLMTGPGFADGLRAQTPEASAIPVNPAAAAGMTSGLPNGVTNQQAEMMQVRTSAQGAQGEAAAALMARSADQSLEGRNQEIALQSAREKKSIKQSMTERLKFENAAASYNKVSANDMSTWKTQGGGVRVERNVPDAFLSALIAEEEQTAERTGAGNDRKGFGLFRKDNSSPADSGGGFFSGIQPPRLPFMGGNSGNSAEAAAPPPPSDTSEPSFVQTSGAGSGSRSAAPSAATPAAVPASVKTAKPGVVPTISAAALINGQSPAKPAVAGAADQAAASAQTVSFADSTPDPDKKKPGLFSKLQSGDDTSMVPATSTGGGFFGFGKKKPSTAGKIDAGLFPEGAVSESPAAGRSIEGFTKVEPGATDSFASTTPGAVPAMVSSSSGSVELPGQSMEKKKGFSLPKPNLSLPSLPSITKSEGSGGAGVPTLTTVNSSGSSYYVVATAAQFMVYGVNQMQSEVRALSVGTLVLMTKPGEQWASVRLQNGTEGILQNKNLRPAAAGEANVEFAAPAAPAAPVADAAPR